MPGARSPSNHQLNALTHSVIFSHPWFCVSQAGSNDASMQHGKSKTHHRIFPFSTLRIALTTRATGTEGSCHYHHFDRSLERFHSRKTLQRYGGIDQPYGSSRPSGLLLPESRQARPTLKIHQPAAGRHPGGIKLCKRLPHHVA